MALIQELRSRISPDVREAEPMAPHTTLRIGGPAEFFIEAKTADDAVKAAGAAKELGVPMFVFGGGSNMIVSDEGVKGLVIMMANRGFTISGPTVTAEAGAPSGLVSMRTAEAGLAGFEWAAGLPGTIGGAVRGNAGMFGGEMKDSVTEVRALKDGAEVVLSNADCAFGYRDSIFKRQPGMIVLSATLALKPGADPAALKALQQKYIIDKKDKQPVEHFSAGCVFTNWRPSGPADAEALRKALDLDKGEVVPFTSQGTIPAGWIIDRAQLKGMKMAHVMVSEKHGNFFVNLGGAKAEELIALIAAVKTRIRNMTHGMVQLQEEVEYVGF